MRRASAGHNVAYVCPRAQNFGIDLGGSAGTPPKPFRGTVGDRPAEHVVADQGREVVDLHARRFAAQAALQIYAGKQTPPELFVDAACEAGGRHDGKGGSGSGEA